MDGAERRKLNVRLTLRSAQTIRRRYDGRRLRNGDFCRILVCHIRSLRWRTTSQTLETARTASGTPLTKSVSEYHIQDRAWQAKRSVHHQPDLWEATFTLATSYCWVIA